MATLEILKDARALIAKPECHTKGVAARDEKRESTSVDSPYATCWCLWGALVKAGAHRAMDGDISPPIVRVMEAVGIDPEERSLVALFDWNDSHTHAEILAALDRAIAIESAA
jgi:hypothetical protein